MIRQSEVVTDIYGALIKAQSQFEIAKKNTKNAYFKTHYADMASIVGACRDALSKNGLGFTQMVFEKDGVTYLTTRLIHISGQWLESDVRVRVIKDEPQSFGSGLTYIKRYALQALLGVIAEDEDDDGEKAMGRGFEQQPKTMQNFAKPNTPAQPLAKPAQKAAQQTNFEEREPLFPPEPDPMPPESFQDHHEPNESTNSSEKIWVKAKGEYPVLKSLAMAAGFHYNKERKGFIKMVSKGELFENTWGFKTEPIS